MNHSTEGMEFQAKPFGLSSFDWVLDIIMAKELSYM